jgi:MYXO-CTERM domain-containing protein
MKTLISVLTLTAAVSSAASADLIAGWSIPNSIPAATTGSSYTYGAANQGVQTAGSSLSGFHALAATTWSSPAGNGSLYSLSSNNWSVGDYYQIAVSTVGFTDISLSWDQTRSGTGPSVFSVAVSTDGTNFTTILASYTVIANVASGTILAWSTGGTPQSAFTTTISAIAQASDAATVYFRFVNQSTVATGGTNRVDNILVNGTAIPTPGALALLGLAGLVARRRR